MIQQSTTPAKLKKARESHVTLITLFLKCTLKYSNETIWVFEGKDVKYYGPRIESASGARPRAIVYAGGKTNVLKLFDYYRTNPDLSAIKCGFFVDKDFDKSHPNHPDLYVTPTYSVENFYATEHCLSKILQGQFDLNCFQSEPIIQRICASYEKWLKKFLKATLCFNAWISIQKKQPEYKLRLNEIGIDEIVKLNWNGSKLNVKSLLNLISLRKKFPTLTPISAIEIKNEITSNFNGNLLHLSRGKYLSEFMYEVLKYLIEDARKKTTVFFKTKRTVTLTISKVNILSDLCAYADTPQCLKTFIAAHVV